MRLAFVALLSIACDRGSTRDKPPIKTPSKPITQGSAPAAAAPSGASCTLSPLPLRRAQPKRVVAIGDLHGDLAATRSALKAAAVIDDKDNWIGKDTVVVQTGDILDRGDDEQAILDLLFDLEGKAKAAGGAMIVLLGNHELMNAAGDFRYVTPGAMKDFDDAKGLDTSRWEKAPENVRGRISALGPGGVYAKKLAEHDVIAIVGDTIYSHAGVIGPWVTQVEEVNMTSRCWLDGQAGGPEAPPIAMTSEESPVWTRALGLDPVDCNALKDALAKLDVKRMVVGHTVQQNGINSTCDGAVWRIDVGLAKLYGGPIEVLELVEGAAPKVLRGTR